MEKIVFLLDYNPFITSGASANRWQGIITSFKKLGYDITVFICKGISQKDEIDELKTISGDIKFIYISRLPFYNINLGKVNNLSKGFLTKIWLSFILKFKNYNSEIQKSDYIFLMNTPFVNYIFSKLKIRESTKILTEVNEEISHSFKTKSDYSLFNKSIVPRVDAVWAMTENILKQYKKSGTKKKCQLKILPMSVDTERFNVQPSDKFDSPYILYVGTLNDEKDGVALLVEAFAMISNEYPILKLVLGGWYFDKMVQKQKEIINKYKINDRVIYTGELKRYEIPAIMKNARINCLARPESRQANYGFPTKLGEYLASGRPVCVTKVGEIPNYLTDKLSAVLVEPNSASAFANGLRYLLSNEQNADKIGEEGKKVALNEFSLYKQQELIKTYMEELTNSNN